MTRQRGIIVYKVTVPDDMGYAPYPSALAFDRQSFAYLICSEGVGRKITDAELLRIPEATRMPAEREQVDLADWIRTFGSRLEVNFHLWVRTLTDDAQDEPRCPACGEPPDYCQGHGPTGDPEGWRILCDHDNGNHAHCSRLAECGGSDES